MEISYLFTDAGSMTSPQLSRVETTLYDLIEAINSGKDRSGLDDIFDCLILYSEDHFNREEQLMQDQSFPEYEVHRKKYEHLIKKMLEVQRQYRTGDIEMDMDFLNFLRD